MHSLPNALIRRSPLLPHESLASLLVRLGMLNFYDPPTIIYQLCLESLPAHSRRRLAAPRTLTLFTRIAALTKLPLNDLYRATAHRFAEVLTPPDDMLETLELPDVGMVPVLGDLVVQRNIRVEAAGQWCPVCLQEQPYYRLHWQPIAVAACLQHECLLVHRCGTCAYPVPVRQIMEAVCRRCGADLRTTPTVSVSGDSWGLTTQNIIQAWLMNGVTPATETHGLPTQPLRTLFRVLDGFRFAASVAEPTWPHLHRLPGMPSAWTRVPDTRAHPTPLQSYYLYATAMKGLVDWPHGFVTWLKAYRGRGPIPRQGQLGTDLGVVYQTWIERLAASRFSVSTGGV